MAPKTRRSPLTVPQDTLADASDGTPVVLAAGVYYVMRTWWRPGLPPLQQNGELVVADNGREARLAQLRLIVAEINRGSWNEEIPAEDLVTIKNQATHWLTIMGDNQ